MTYIYALIDPITREPRYVGKSDRPKIRLLQHEKDGSNSHKANWIKCLKRRGLRPELSILCAVNKTKWEEVEKHYILKFRMLGYKLTNICDGGQGVTHTPEIRAKLSAAVKNTHWSKSDKCDVVNIKARLAKASSGNKNRKGKIHSEESKQKMSASHYKMTKETRDKIGLAHKGKVLSCETRLKMSKSRKGRSFSEQHILNLSAAAKKRKISPEGRKLLSDAHIGKSNGPWSEERRAKFSQTWANKRAAKETTFENFSQRC